MIEITVSTTPVRKDENDVPNRTPIFAKNERGELVGMVVKENKGWILRTGGETGAAGYYGDRRTCMNVCIDLNCTFHIEE